MPDYSPQLTPIEGFDRVKQLLGPLMNAVGALAGPEYRLSPKTLSVQEIVMASTVKSVHEFIFATDFHIGTPGQMDEAGIDIVFDRILPLLDDPTSQKAFLIGGDIVNKPLYPVDNATSYYVFPKLLERLSEVIRLGIPVVAVPGNHDLENPDWVDYYLPNLEAIGVNMLDNFQVCYVGEIPIVGVPDYTQPQVMANFAESVEHARENLDLYLSPEIETIFLSHNPDAVYILERLLHKHDIVLSGHSHRSGYTMDQGLMAGLLGRLALKASPVNDIQSSKYGRRSLSSGAILYNPAGLGNHPLHGTRRIGHELLNLVFMPYK